MARVRGNRRRHNRVYYTPERIAAARKNVTAYTWGREVMKRIINGDPAKYYVGHTYVSARDYAAQSDDFIWMLLPTTRIPRIIPHDRRRLCPIHGKEGRSHSAWFPWKADPIRHPYKIQCAAGGEWYPSNDFMNGDMTSGKYADDGSGAVVNGERFYFLREYAHFAYTAITVPCLRALSQAYLITGDRRYAHKGMILLARVAHEYPNHKDRKDRLYYATTGGHDRDIKWKYGGMITDLIWETFCVEALAYAYDGLQPYFDEDGEAIAFLRKKGLPIRNAQDLRRYIKEYIFRAAMHAILIKDICGNEGFHQAAALACALVMDDYSDTRPNSKEMVDYAYHGEGQTAYMLINGLHRDGGGHESPGYNRIKLYFCKVADLMEDIRGRHPDKFPLDKYPAIFAEPKARKLFDWFIDITMLDYFSPSVGDFGDIAPPERAAPRYHSMLEAQHLYVFKRYGDPRHARAATRPDGTLFAGDLFDPFPAAKIKEALADPGSRIERKPRLSDGYGLAILESGNGLDGRAACLNYSSLRGHRQFDNLTLELFARGVSLLPDLGYPLTWDYRTRWDTNIMAHNTVTVDETQPSRGMGGNCRLFASRDGVHVVTADHDPYKGVTLGKKDAKPVTLYERTVLMVDVAPDKFYVVDLFAVRGGEQHDQSWHGPLVPVQRPKLKWRMQKGGTLAGRDVERFTSWTDRWGRERDDFPCFLGDIRRAELKRPAAWTWKTGLPEGDTLRLHVLPVGAAAEVILGSGTSPARPEEWKLDYLLVRRNGRRGARSLFLSVLDAYQKTPVVKRVKLVSQDPLKLQVVRAGAVDEITLNIPKGPSCTHMHRPVGVRVVTRKGRRIVRDVRIGRLPGKSGPGYAFGMIRKLNYESDEIAIADAAGRESDFAPGRAVRIYNGEKSHMYRVKSSRRDGKLFRITLDATALMARGPVKNVRKNAVVFDARFVFANKNPGQRGYQPSANDPFSGSWIGEGETARRVKKALQRGTTTVHLHGNDTAAALRRHYAGKVVSIWHYGIGDRVEAARIETK